MTDATTPRRPCPVDYPHNSHAYFNPAWAGSCATRNPTGCAAPVAILTR
jgi:hypothetical protein